METCDVRLSINSTAHSLYLFLFICLPPLPLIDLSLLHPPASVNDYLISGQPKKRMPSSLFLFFDCFKRKIINNGMFRAALQMKLVCSCGKLVGACCV